MIIPGTIKSNVQLGENSALIRIRVYVYFDNVIKYAYVLTDVAKPSECLKLSYFRIPADHAAARNVDQCVWFCITVQERESL